jgi:hypothetical protein
MTKRDHGVRAGVAVMALLSFTPLVGAQSTALGDGAYACREWTAERKTNSTRSKMTSTWLLGFLSGVNATPVSPPRDILSGVNIDELLAWVDKFCTDNPSTNVGTAAAKLAEELRNRSREKKPSS